MIGSFVIWEGDGGVRVIKPLEICALTDKRETNMNIHHFKASIEMLEERCANVLGRLVNLNVVAVGEEQVQAQPPTEGIKPMPPQLSDSGGALGSVRMSLVRANKLLDNIDDQCTRAESWALDAPMPVLRKQE